MSVIDNDETTALQQEFEWLINEEVNVIFCQLQNILLECCRRFPVTIPGLQTLMKNESFSLVQNNPTQQDQLKISVTLHGSNISFADIHIRLQKYSVPAQRFYVQNDCQWKLNQIQDASNHLMAALCYLTSPPLRFNEQEKKLNFMSAEEIVHMINSVMNSLQKGRNSLIVPKKSTIEELQHSRNMKSIQPSVPHDLAITFYIQSHKLICALYHIEKDQKGITKFDTLQAETSVPWLSEALVLFTVALQCCQQLKDKVSVFTQYKDMQVNAPTAQI